MFESFAQKALGKYFKIFLKNFSPEGDLSLNFFAGKASLRNIEINEEILQDILCPVLPNLIVTKAVISQIDAKVPITQLQKVSTELIIDEIEIVLEEPEQLKTYQNLLSKLLNPPEKKKKEKIEKQEKKEKEKKEKKEKENKEKLKKRQNLTSDTKVKSNLTEKVIAGIRISIRKLSVTLKTLTGVPLLLTIKDFKLYPTNEKWEAVSLRETRAFSKKRVEFFSFREITFKLDVRLFDMEALFPLLTDQEFKIHITTEKKFKGENLSAIQINIMTSLSLEIAPSSAGLLVKFLKGITSCFSRSDIPVRKVDFMKEVYHPLLILNVILPKTFVKIYGIEESKFEDVFQIEMSDIRISKISPETCPDYESRIQFTLGSIIFKEINSGTIILGPTSQTNVIKEIPFWSNCNILPSPSDKPSYKEMMLIHAIVRKPCPSSKISSELNARFNNIEISAYRGYLESFIDIILVTLFIYSAASAEIEELHKVFTEKLLQKFSESPSKETIVVINQSSTASIMMNVDFFIPPNSKKAPPLFLKIENMHLQVSSNIPTEDKSAPTQKIFISLPAVYLLEQSKLIMALDTMNLDVLKYAQKKESSIKISIKKIDIQVDNERKIDLLDMIEDHLLFSKSSQIFLENIKTVQRLKQASKFKIRSNISLQMELKEVVSTFIILRENSILVATKVNSPSMNQFYSDMDLTVDVPFQERIENIQVLTLKQINLELKKNHNQKSLFLSVNMKNLVFEDETNQKKFTILQILSSYRPFFRIEFDRKSLDDIQVYAAIEGLQFGIHLGPIMALKTFFSREDQSQFKRLTILCIEIKKKALSALNSIVQPEEMNFELLLKDLPWKKLKGKTFKIEVLNWTFSFPNSQNQSFPLNIQSLSVVKAASKEKDEIKIESKQFLSTSSFNLFGFVINLSRLAENNDWKSCFSINIGEGNLTMSGEELKFIQSIIQHQLEAFDKVKKFTLSKEKKRVVLTETIADRLALVHKDIQAATEMIQLNQEIEVANKLLKKSLEEQARLLNLLQSS